MPIDTFDITGMIYHSTSINYEIEVLFPNNMDLDWCAYKLESPLVWAMEGSFL